MEMEEYPVKYCKYQVVGSKEHPAEPCFPDARRVFKQAFHVPAGLPEPEIFVNVPVEDPVEGRGELAGI